MGTTIETHQTSPAAHRAKVGVECPQCHWKQYVEVQLEKSQLDNPLAVEIRNQLEAWMASRCPDHLNAISMLSRN